MMSFYDQAEVSQVDNENQGNGVRHLFRVFENSRQFGESDQYCHNPQNSMEQPIRVQSVLNNNHGGEANAN